MSLVIARLVVTKSTPYTAPLLLDLQGHEPFLKEISVTTSSSVALDKSGFRIDWPGGKRIVPMVGYCDTATNLTGRGEFSPVWVATCPQFIQVGAEISGPPYIVRMKFYNEDGSNDMLVSVILNMGQKEKPFNVIDLAALQALLNPPH